MATTHYTPPDDPGGYGRALEANPQLLAAAENMGDSACASEDGAVLIRDIESYLAKYVVFPLQTLLPIALWVIATFIFELFDAFPYLVMSSPTKQCGKSRALEVLLLIVFSPRKVANPSEAALFRMIEKFRPTLMLDEAETLNGKGERAEYLRAILNAGNRRNASVPRCVGQGVNQDVADFNIYCPKIVAGIGSFPETITDRAICISMQRRKQSEQVSRFLFRTAAPLGEALRERIGKFVKSHSDEIKTAYEAADLPFLPDRDAEAWQPLFALLAVADAARVAELRGCAEALTGIKASDAEDDSLQLRLLSDLRNIWPPDERYVLTADLLNRLKGIEDAPWAEGTELNPRRLARLLRGFKVRPLTVRAGGKNGKGYCRDEAETAFSRYLVSEPSHASHLDA